MVVENMRYKSKKVPLSKIISELNLEVVYLPRSSEDIFIESKKINRPGLHLVGYFDWFDDKKIQIMGRSEYGYLLKLK